VAGQFFIFIFYILFTFLFTKSNRNNH
jgi:hypothetical protein